MYSLQYANYRILEILDSRLTVLPSHPGLGVHDGFVDRRAWQGRTSPGFHARKFPHRNHVRTY